VVGGVDPDVGLVVVARYKERKRSAFLFSMETET
jgi:hypothetical protein